MSYFLIRAHPSGTPNDLGAVLMSDRQNAIVNSLPMPDNSIELSWQERALCAQTDPEAFFPEKGGSTREAKRVCLSCDVRSECLEYALAHDERFGIWGGLSERERRRLKRRSA
jgi:WhiB family transcriptional regulator, redox-sensing transcriptional regulator